MKKLRIGLIIVAVVVIIANLTFLDYGNLTWSKNSALYLGIMAMVCVIIGSAWANRNDQERVK